MISPAPWGHQAERGKCNGIVLEFAKFVANVFIQVYPDSLLSEKLSIWEVCDLFDYTPKIPTVALHFGSSLMLYPQNIHV